jgi:restriction system protein
MSPDEFEEFLAQLCERDGCRNVQVVGGANDHGADVLYTDPRGQRGLIQAKRYTPGNSVGNEHVQIVNGTYRDAHSCAHAAIVTTSHFTQPAQAFAKRVGIRLLDDHRLDLWIRGHANAAPWN